MNEDIKSAIAPKIDELLSILIEGSKEHQIASEIRSMLIEPTGPRVMGSDLD